MEGQSSSANSYNGTIGFSHGMNFNNAVSTQHNVAPENAPSQGHFTSMRSSSAVSSQCQFIFGNSNQECGLLYSDGRHVGMGQRLEGRNSGLIPSGPSALHASSSFFLPPIRLNVADQGDDSDRGQVSGTLGHVIDGNSNMQFPGETWVFSPMSPDLPWVPRDDGDADAEDDMLDDMRLDIDDMSYEELLALGDHIGNVSTGLGIESILACMWRRRYQSSTIGPQLGGSTCCICQDGYDNGQEIGKLDCGHDFHFECIKQWLMEKNSCPVCKKTASAT